MADKGSPKAAADGTITDNVTDVVPAAAVVEESAKQSVEAAANGTSEDAPAEQEDEAEAAGKGKNRKNKKGAAAKAAAADAGAAAENTAAAASKSGDLGTASTEADAVAKSSDEAATAATGSSSALIDPETKASPAAADTAASATTGSVSRSNSSSTAAAAVEQPQRTSSTCGISPTPAPAEAAAAAAAGSGSLDDLADAPKVKALREQLSQNGTVALTGGVAQPPPPEPKPEAGPSRRLSEHDRVNNTNALELLQSGSFKLVPGKDSVPYEKLMGLRLEDGIDVTRKEEYLTGDEFAVVFKMERETFLKLPQWKRLQLKKSTLLF